MSAPIGGQAVLEGVMMRGPSNWAVAVRKPNGQIAEVCRPIDSVMKRHWFFRLPVIRGVIALGESLAIGELIGRQTCAMSPLGLRTATAHVDGPRIITPSRTACPPIAWLMRRCV